ncbi:MAG: heparan-alpha-glucosaminide N-acetyltransferase domain-containing protein [Myxococcaceae bacterium]
MSEGRLRAFDWLRGLAVLVMVQTHALFLVQPALRVGEAFHWLNFVDGLVAPTFLFAAGFSLGLTQVRAAQANDSARRLRKTALRLVEVLFIACLLNWMWFPVFREPIWWLRFDILHCLGLNLMLLLPFANKLGSRPRVLAASMIVLGVAVFLVAPLLENVPGIAGRFVNEKTGALFPMIPWLGHIAAGVAVGAIAAAESRRTLAVFLLVLGVVGFALYRLTWPIASLYPPHEVWRTNIGPHGVRLFWVAALSLLLLGVERAAAAKNPVVAFIETFGTSSLSAYFFHLFFLYYELIHGASFRAHWNDKLDWSGYVVAVIALTALTYVAVRLWDLLDRRLRTVRKPA